MVCDPRQARDHPHHTALLLGSTRSLLTAENEELLRQQIDALQRDQPPRPPSAESVGRFRAIYSANHCTSCQPRVADHATATGTPKRFPRICVCAPDPLTSRAPPHRRPATQLAPGKRSTDFTHDTPEGILDVSKRVLVTGGLGYLGSVACEHLLANGYQVTALDNLMYGPGQGLFHLAPTRPSTSSRATSVTSRSCDAPRVRTRSSTSRESSARVRVRPRPGDGDVGEPRTRCGSSNRSRSREQLVVFPNTNSGYGATSGTSLCTEETPLRTGLALRPHQVRGGTGAARQPQRRHTAAGDGLRDVAADAARPAREPLRSRRR